MCKAMCAISTTSRRKLSSSFFFLQGKASKEIYAILTGTLGEHAPSYVTVEKCVRSVLNFMGSMLNKSRVWSL